MLIFIVDFALKLFAYSGRNCMYVSPSEILILQEEVDMSENIVVRKNFLFNV